MLFWPESAENLDISMHCSLCDCILPDIDGCW